MIQFFCLRSSSWPNLMKRKKVVKHGLFVLFFLVLVCFCFRFFLVKRFQSIFLIFIIFLTAITIAILKTAFFSFSQHCGFCLFVCFCVVTQNFETGDESRSAEQKSF